MAVYLYRLKALRWVPHFPLQNHQILRRHILTSSSSSETSPANQHSSDFTVNYLINSCGLSQDGAISASKKINLKSREKPDAVLELLKSHGLSETQISKLVRVSPQLLTFNPEKKLLPKFEYFISLGVSNDDLAKILVSNPCLLSSSLPKRIVPTYDFLRSMLSEKNVVAVFKRSTRIFIQSHSKNVVPNIELLRDLGVPQSCISLCLAHFCPALTRNPQNFEKVVDKVKQMGFSVEKTSFVWAINALASCNSKLIWQRSSQVYRRWGWSEDDVVSAYKKYPQCMTHSEKKIMETMDVLVNKTGWPSGKVAEYPVVLSLSLEKRITPRCSVIKVLLLKGLVKIENLRLSAVLIPVENNFLEKFVDRYLERVPQLLSVYQGKVNIQEICS